MRAERITTLHFVPSMLEAFLADEDVTDDVAWAAALRTVVSSGEALPPATARRWHDLTGVADPQPVRAHRGRGRRHLVGRATTRRPSARRRCRSAVRSGTPGAVVLDHHLRPVPGRRAGRAVPHRRPARPRLPRAARPDRRPLRRRPPRRARRAHVPHRRPRPPPRRRRPRVPRPHRPPGEDPRQPHRAGRGRGRARRAPRRRPRRGRRPARPGPRAASRRLRRAGRRVGARGGRPRRPGRGPRPPARRHGPGAFVRLDDVPLTTSGKVDRRALPDPTATDGATGGGVRAAATGAVAVVGGERTSPPCSPRCSDGTRSGPTTTSSRWAATASSPSP